MHTAKLEALYQRVRAALDGAGLMARSVKAVEVLEDRVEVRTSKAVLGKVQDALGAKALGNYSLSATSVTVPISQNTGVKLTVVEAGNEETFEVGFIGHATKLLEGAKGDSARIEWNDRVNGNPIARTRTYTYVNGRWQSWV